MELKHMLSFVTVVKYQSFSRAAQSLYISQPSISTHIQLIEKEVGNPLLYRTSRSLEITEAGRTFYEYAVNVLNMCDRMVSICGAEQKKDIHIGASDVIACGWLPQVVARFSEEHPEYSFSIDKQSNVRVNAEIPNHVYDLGFVDETIEDSDLDYIPLHKDRLVVIAPKAEPFEAMGGNASELRLLLAQPFISETRGEGIGADLRTLAAYAGVDESTLHLPVKVNSHEAVKRLVKQGLGAALISESLIEEAEVGRDFLVFGLPEEAAVKQVYMVTGKNGFIRPYVREFMDFVLNMLNSR